MSEVEITEDISKYEGRIIIYHPESSFKYLEAAIRKWLYCERSGWLNHYLPYDPPINYFATHTVPLLPPEGHDAGYEDDILSEPGLTLVYMTDLPLPGRHCQNITCLVDNDEQTVTLNIPHTAKRASDIDRSDRWWLYHSDGPEIWWDGLRMKFDDEGECAVAERDNFDGTRSQFRASEFSRLYRTVIRAVTYHTGRPSEEPDSSYLQK
ncbi:hypothetical protein LTR86_000486 [Recurvomyces mirabilis]|nr:hypothetical protein LTR86_000486 [Recurvomyces mirabilis]